MSWTDERVEILKEMWADGSSASEIAKKLGGVTRNAVIGKVHRLGLSNRSSASETAPAVPAPESESPAEVPVIEAAGTHAAEKPAADPDPAPAAEIDGEENETPLRRAIITAGQPRPPQRSANEISPEALASARAVEKTARRLSLMELTERTCKWPVGDPASDDFWFCGLPSQAGKPYCKAHVEVAFQPMNSRRDRRR